MRHPFLLTVFLPELPRRHAGLRPEDLAEIIAVGKAALRGDVADREFRVEQQFRRPADPETEQILDRTASRRFFELQKQISPRHARFASQLFDGDILRVMRVDIGDRLTDLERHGFQLVRSGIEPAEHDDDLQEYRETVQIAAWPRGFEFQFHIADHSRNGFKFIGFQMQHRFRRPMDLFRIVGKEDLEKRHPAAVEDRQVQPPGIIDDVDHFQAVELVVGMRRAGVDH